MTTATGTTIPAAATPTRANAAALLPSVWVVAARGVRQYLRSPQVVVFSAAQAVAFLLIFRYVFGGAIGTGGLRYVDFMIPGLVTVTVLFTGMGTVVAVAEDTQQGVFDRFRSLPMPAGAVPVGRVLADTGRLALTLAVTVAIAFAVGFRVHAGWLPALAAFALCVLFGVACLWLFVALGLLTGNVQAAQGVGFLVLPVSFASSAYVPVDTMPGWLRAFAEHQPVSVVINATRALTQGPAAEALLGHDAAHFVLLSLAWIGALVAVFAPLAIVLFKRR